MSKINTIMHKVVQQGNELEAQSAIMLREEIGAKGRTYRLSMNTWKNDNKWDFLTTWIGEYSDKAKAVEAFNQLAKLFEKE